MTNSPEIEAEGSNFKLRASLFVISIVVTIAIFIWIFARIDLEQVWSLIYRANKRAIAAFLIASLATSLFRAWRYRLLLGAVGYRPNRFALYLVTLIRNLFSDLLPARLGTLMYVYLVTTRLGVPIGAASSSFALSFIFDFVALAPLIVIATFALSPGIGISTNWLLIGACIFAAGSIFALICLPQLLKISRLCTQKIKFLPSRLQDLICRNLSRVEAALDETIKAKIYFQVLCLSILVRLGKYVALYLLLYAMLAPLGYTLGNLHFSKVFIGLVSAELAASLPISAPGGIGVYQGAWALTFQLLGFEESIAKATSVSHHLFTQAYGYSLGLIAMLILSLPFFRVPTANSTVFKRSSNLAHTATVLLVVFLIVAAIVAALQ